MLATAARARYAIAIPSPVATGGFVVCWYTCPAPPAARSVALASTVLTTPVWLSRT